MSDAKKRACIFFSLFFSFMANASGSSSINWWHLGPAYSDAPAIGWLTITFLIFVYACVRVVRKPLSLYLETRSKDIRRQIEEAAKAKVLGEENLKRYQEKLKSLDNEILLLKASYQEQAEAERQERARSAKEHEARVLKDTEETIKANYERLKIRLAEEVVEKALALAKETIATKNKIQIDQVLQKSFIEDLKTSVKELENDVSASDRKAVRERAHDVYQRP